MNKLAALRPETVARAARLFGADPRDPDAAPQPVNLGVNHVYRAGARSERDMALRFTHPAQRNADFLGPPLAWLRHLHAAGAPVCEPLPSRAGRWTEALEQAGDTFLATAVRWVEGPRLSDLPPTPELYRAYGRAIGALHRCGATFRLPAGTPPMFGPPQPGPPSSNPFPPHDWLWSQAAPAAGAHPILAAAFARLTPLVEAWQREDGVGLTHGDLRPGNVIVQPGTEQNGRAVIIDFDEPVLGPLALDLARALLELRPQQRAELTPSLLAGYREEQPLSAVWEARLPALIAMRATLMAAWFAQDGMTAMLSGSGASVSFPALLRELDRWQANKNGPE